MKSAIKQTLFQLQTARNQTEFLLAADKIPILGEISPSATLNFLQIFTNQWKNSGFESNFAVNFLSKRISSFPLYQQVKSLHLLSQISPKTRGNEINSLLNGLISSLSTSNLHEITTESLGLLLDIGSEYRVRSEKLWEYCVKRVQEGSEMTGVMPETVLVQVLRAAGELKYDISPVKERVGTTVSRKLKEMKGMKGYLGLYLTQLGLFESGKEVLQEVLRQEIPRNVKRLDVVHRMLLGFTLFAPSHSDIPGLDQYQSRLQATLSQLPPLCSPPSPLQTDIMRVLSTLNIPYSREVLLPPPSFFSIDIQLQQGGLVEVQGPTHYIQNSEIQTGTTEFKAKIVKKLGFKLTEIPFFEWNRVKASSKSEYLRKKLQF